MMIVNDDIDDNKDEDDKEENDENEESHHVPCLLLRQSLPCLDPCTRRARGLRHHHDENVHYDHDLDS